MTYSTDDSGTDSFNLPEFDLEVYEIAIEFGSSEEEALEVAFAATNDFEPLDTDNLGLE